MRCSAALLAHAWSFHREAADIAKDVPVHIYSVRGDATNTRVLHNSKLHNLEVEAFHLTQLDLLDPREEPDNQYSVLHRIVPKPIFNLSATAQGTAYTPCHQSRTDLSAPQRGRTRWLG